MGIRHHSRQRMRVLWSPDQPRVGGGERRSFGLREPSRWTSDWGCRRRGLPPSGRLRSRHCRCCGGGVGVEWEDYFRSSSENRVPARLPGRAPSRPTPDATSAQEWGTHPSVAASFRPVSRCENSRSVCEPSMNFEGAQRLRSNKEVTLVDPRCCRLRKECWIRGTRPASTSRRMLLQATFIEARNRVLRQWPGGPMLLRHF
jgi:hypothetical protein